MPTLLVIGDNPGTLFCVRTAVPQWQVVSASSGVIGLDILQQRQFLPDLIVVDTHLPDLDGLSLCTQIRALHNTIPILFYTDHHVPFAILDELGCMTSLLKPAMIEEIIAALHDTIGQTATSPTTVLAQTACRQVA
ncbi:MAG: response regulator [Chloroflexota bacterium]